MGERQLPIDQPQRITVVRRAVRRFLPILFAILGLSVATAGTVSPTHAHQKAKLTPGADLMYAIAVRPAPAPIRAPAPHFKTVEMLVTAYCPCKLCCGPHADGITASGRPVSYNGGHFIAADTHLLPFGSKVIIPGYDNGQPVPVIDRGGAIIGNHIDVFFPVHKEAVNWGRRWIRVTIVSR